MKVILLKDLRRLGKEGEVAEVKDGYARNYLLPQGFALMATPRNFKRLQEVKKTRSKMEEKKRQSFLKVKEQIEKVSLTIPVEAKENDELYGAISQAQILKLLKTEGVDLEKDKLILEEPIEKLGVYSLKVDIYPEVEAVLRVWVVKK